MIAAPAKPHSTSLNADRLGIWASALCVVHCLLTPVVVALSPVAAQFLPGEASTHRAFAVVVASLGCFALIRGFRRHRRARVLALMASGLSLILGAAWFADRLPNRTSEILITLCGSAFMITAHRLNHTFCKSCACAHDHVSSI